jgi:hypothetical protein
MMRISHTCRSRSPVTHPKTPVDSTPRPITAAAPRKRAPTHHYKPHPSYSSHYWLLPTKPPLSRFLQGLGFNLASPKLCGQAAEQGGCPRSCGRPLCSATSPPSAARRPATTSISPWARVAAVSGFMYFSFSPCSAATHARGGNMLFEKPLLLRKSYERPSRLTHGLSLMMSKNTAPAADSTTNFRL